MKETLTPRQQKILEMLLNGTQPKEIAFNLHISYNTFLTHQKRLYRKLGVHSIYELMAKYAPQEAGAVVQAQTRQPSVAVDAQENLSAGWWLIINKKTLPVKGLIAGIVMLAAVLGFVLLFMRKPADAGYPAVFNQWAPIKDGEGSSLTVTVTPDDIIDGKPFTSYAMTGELFGEKYQGFAIMSLYPAPFTQQAMRKMTSFSFKIMGDGTPYMVRFTTAETIVENGDMDHYGTMFPTAKGQISTITIDTDDLMQRGNGIPVPFNPNNIQSVEFVIEGGFLAESSGQSSRQFNFKIWDIRIF